MEQYIQAAERDITSMNSIVDDAIGYMSKTMADDRYSPDHKREQAKSRQRQEIAALESTVQNRLDALATQTAQAESVVNAVHIPSPDELQQLSYVRDYLTSQWLVASDPMEAMTNSYQTALKGENKAVLRAHQVYAPSFAMSHFTDEKQLIKARMTLGEYGTQATQALMSTEQRQAQDFLAAVPRIKQELGGAVERMKRTAIKPDGSIEDGTIADIKTRFNIA